ncbi:MAG: hypothetical protein OEY11_04820 [Gammaproteobacteria bacterium]|nr:hypothetical protein [Gammaproteobacteria bacterium]
MKLCRHFFFYLLALTLFGQLAAASAVDSDMLLADDLYDARLLIEDFSDDTDELGADISVQFDRQPDDFALATNKYDFLLQIALLADARAPPLVL